MNENTQSDYFQSPINPVCKSCQVVPALPDSPSQLCATCRQEFVKYPVPKWVQASGAVLVLLLIIGIVRVAPMLQLALDLSRAQKAIAAHKYITAQNELKNIVAQRPDFIEAKYLFFIAACYNQERDLAQGFFKEFDGVRLDLDDDIQSKAQDAAIFVNSIIMFDTSVDDSIDAAALVSSGRLLRLFEVVDTSHFTADGGDTLGRRERLNSLFCIAHKMFDLKFYDETRDMAKRILRYDPGHYNTIGLLATLNTRLKRYDEAIANCNQQLAINCEDIYFLAMKARLEVKKRDGKNAALHADEAYRLAPKNPYALEAKAVLAWFNTKPPEAERFLGLLKAVEDDSEKVIYQRAARVINGSDFDD